MSCAPSQRAFTSPAIPAATGFVERPYLQNPSAQYRPSLPNQYEGNQMSVSLRDSRNFNRGEQSKTERSATSDCARWLAAFFRSTPAKVIANDAGVNLRAAENVKQGRNGLTMAHLENLCRSNPDFRAAWFARCGGFLEGDPEMVAALSKAINAIVRGK